MSVLEQYATINEAAKKLKIHPETVKRLIRQGDIPAIKIRNTWFIDKDRLEVLAGTYQPKRGRKKRLL